MLSLNRIETRSLATATALVLVGTGLRLGFGPGSGDTGWQPPPDTEAATTPAAGLRASVEEGIQREERAGVPLAAGERLDPNFADETELRRLPGIGPELAGRIMEFRDRRGGFRKVDDLLAIPGIGPGTVEKIRNRLRIR